MPHAGEIMAVFRTIIQVGKVVSRFVGRKLAGRTDGVTEGVVGGGLSEAFGPKYGVH